LVGIVPGGGCGVFTVVLLVNMGPVRVAMLVVRRWFLTGMRRHYRPLATPVVGDLGAGTVKTQVWAASVDELVDISN
jgi:hypothetical protein